MKEGWGWECTEIRKGGSRSEYQFGVEGYTGLKVRKKGQLGVVATS